MPSNLSRRSLLSAIAVGGLATLVSRPAFALDGTSPSRGPVFVSPIVPAAGRDVTDELTTWLRSLPAGAVADLAGRTYRCERPVQLIDPVGITIRNGSLVRTDRVAHGGIVYPKPNPHLWLLRPVDCIIENVKINGTNTLSDGRAGFGSYISTYEFEAGIRLEQFKNCTVRNAIMDGTWGDGIQAHQGTGLYVGDCKIDRNGRQGITIIASDVLIERVRIEHSRRSGFDLEPFSSSIIASGIEIRNCYTNSRLLPYASGGRGQVNNVWIHDNVSDGTSVPVLSVASSDGSRRYGWRFENHIATATLGSTVPALRFTTVDDIWVSGCSLPVATNRSQQALGLASCGGSISANNNNFFGGVYYYNRTPMAGQKVSVNGLRQVS